MSAYKVNKACIEIFVFTSILVVLLLSLVNIENSLKPKKVLGAQTTNADPETSSGQELFWNDFLTRNPDYIPGWIEQGRMDKVKEIDPNYEVANSTQELGVRN